MSKILFVEDSAAQRGAVAKALREAGYEVVEAADGEAGLAAIIEHQPDLVLCDVNMPRMSGFELLEELRRNHQMFAQTPFLFLTSSGGGDAVVAGMELGADDYLTKPIDMRILCLTIQARLRQIARQNETKQEELVRLYKALSEDALGRAGAPAGAADPVGQAPAAALRQDRDRLGAFVEAAADLCVEIDRLGVVRFALGDVEGLLGAPAPLVVARSILEFFAEPDRRYVQELFVNWRRDSRLGPVTVDLKATAGCVPATVELRGSRPPERADHGFLVFSRAAPRAVAEAGDIDRSAPGGLLGKSSFARIASQKLMARGGSEDDHELTLLELEGLSSTVECDADSAEARFAATAGAYLRAASADGDLAGRLDDGKYGIVHDQSLSPEALRRNMTRLVRESGLDHQEIRVRSASIALDSAGLDPDESARALVYAINKFADTRTADFTVSSLSQGLKELVDDTVKRISELKETVAKGAYEIHFQPIVDLKTRRLHHYEALTRLASGESPFEAVCFAEQVGMVEEIDLAVCQNVLDQLILTSATNDEIEVAINLSAKSLENQVFVDVLRKLLRPHRALRKRILFEVTETAQIVSYDRVDKVLRQLRQDGHGICLDDFGAGETTLHYLRVFEVDFVKIDGAYVESVTSVERDRFFVKAIADLCRNLGVATVAERIEQEQQAVELLEMGVDLGQGYLFGRPGPSFLPAAS